jgi:hypothetical protein
MLQYSVQQSVYFREAAVIFHSYEPLLFNASNYQSKLPCIVTNTWQYTHYYNQSPFYFLISYVLISYDFFLCVVF